MQFIDTSSASSKPIQSGLFDSRMKSLTLSTPTTQEVSASAVKPKVIRKKKEVPAPTPEAPAPETKPKVKAPSKKKEAPVSAIAPVSAPAPVSVASASAPSAPSAPAKKAKFAKGSQEAKDYMAAIRTKRGLAKAAVEKAATTPAESEADDVAVVKKVTRKKKAEKEMLA